MSSGAGPRRANRDLDFGNNLRESSPHLTSSSRWFGVSWARVWCCFANAFIGVSVSAMAHLSRGMVRITISSPLFSVIF